MKDMTTQAQRLEYLADAFLKDAGDEVDFVLPVSEEGKRRALRAMMNVRMPAPVNADVLAVQDAYLRERAKEKGIVTVESIPTVRKSLSSGRPHADVISIWQGDITNLAADAIVNAANDAMLGCFVPLHRCIDNCIHTYAGVQLRLECDRQMRALQAKYGQGYRQPTAVPMLTPGYNLPAKHVIHIVGPIVDGELTAAHERALADCYANTLDMCAQNGLAGVAFCCISTGVFRFPADRAAQIAAKTVEDWLTAHPGAMSRVIFNVFSDRDRTLYEEIYG